MSRFLIAVLLLVTIRAPAQLPWMWSVELKCAYDHSRTDPEGRPEHDFLLFYSNDSVVSAWMVTFGTGWEGAYLFNDTLSPGQLIDQFVAEYHCEPGDFDQEVNIQWFAGASLVWKDRYYSDAHFENDGETFISGDTRYERIKCWNTIVRPVKKLPKWSTGCSGDTIR